MNSWESDRGQTMNSWESDRGQTIKSYYYLPYRIAMHQRELMQIISYIETNHSIIKKYYLRNL